MSTKFTDGNSQIWLCVRVRRCRHGACRWNTITIKMRDAILLTLLDLVLLVLLMPLSFKLGLGTCLVLEAQNLVL